MNQNTAVVAPPPLKWIVTAEVVMSPHKASNRKVWLWLRSIMALLETNVAQWNMTHYIDPWFMLFFPVQTDGKHMKMAEIRRNSHIFPPPMAPIPVRYFKGDADDFGALEAESTAATPQLFKLR